MMERKIDVIEDLQGNKTVFIQDIIFKGKRQIEWNEVEKYLKRFVGEFYKIEDSNETIYIGSDLPDEYVNSKYTSDLRGMTAKAKANAVQGLPELIQVASNKKIKPNRKDKHAKDAKFGWYSYESRFALPVFDEDGEIERYNVFNVVMLVRHARSGKRYLYDVINIKKETRNLFQSDDLTQ